MGRMGKAGMCSLPWLLRWPLRVAMLQELNKFSVGSGVTSQPPKAALTTAN